MARRRSLMANRMARMKGLSPDEKDLLVRIGTLVDSAINNRGPTNPHEDPNERIRINNPKLPPPSNIVVERGVRTAKIRFDPIDSPILLHYKYKFLNKDSGRETIRTSYSSEYVFKGDAGSYKILIQSIGRGGISSAARVVEIEIPDNVMILEGAKNGIDTISTIVSETVYVPPGYTVFAWTAFTLNDHSFQDANDVPKVVLKSRLESQTPLQDITEQEVALYPESETVTNLNNAAGLANGETISRPIVAGAPARGANNNETSQTIMFTPVDLPEDKQNQDNTFTVEVEDRAQKDVKSLSIVLWVATGGRGFFVDLPFTPHLNCLENKNSGFSVSYENDNWTNINAGQPWGGSGFDEWSVATWFKFRGANSGTFNFMIHTNDFGGSQLLLRQSVSVASGPDVTALVAVGEQGVGTELVAVFENNLASSELIGINLPNGKDEWTHHVWTFRMGGSGRRAKYYVNGTLVASTDGSGSPSSFFTSDTFSGGSANNRPTLLNDTTSNPLLRAAVAGVSHRIYEQGVWTTELAANEIATLYNGGNGSAISLENNTGSYVSSTDLSIWWRYGFNQPNGEDHSIGSTVDVIFPSTGNSASFTETSDVSPNGATVINDYPGK